MLSYHTVLAILSHFHATRDPDTIHRPITLVMAQTPTISYPVLLELYGPLTLVRTFRLFPVTRVLSATFRCSEAEIRGRSKIRQRCAAGVPHFPFLFLFYSNSRLTCSSLFLSLPMSCSKMMRHYLDPVWSKWIGSISLLPVVSTREGSAPAASGPFICGLLTH